MIFNIHIIKKIDKQNTTKQKQKTKQNKKQNKTKQNIIIGF